LDGGGGVGGGFARVNFWLAGKFHAEAMKGQLGRWYGCNGDFT